MGVLERLKQKLGIASPDAGRHPIRVFLLEDDERRCEWFAKRFKGDQLDIACDVDQAKEMLEARTYDTIFLDHDLMPEDRKSTRLNSSHQIISYAVFCLK